jgi:branched-chain amino acid transport system ATP-binding protein
MNLLEVENLLVDYGGNRALSVGSFAQRQGSLACVAGANGAGKSTFVNALLGWSRGSPRVSGGVRLDGRDIGAWPTTRRVREGILLVPEGRGVFSTLSVEENLRSVPPPPESSGRRFFTDDEVFTLFPRLAERRHHAGGNLSGGERGMLAVGRALKAGPRLLILDEPSIGLAPRLVSILLKAIRGLVDDGLTVLLVEQNVKAALEVSDHVHLFERGKVIAHGSAADMRNDRHLVAAYLGSGHE